LLAGRAIGRSDAIRIGAAGFPRRRLGSSGSVELILPVSCACDNDNECARCGEPLFERRLQCNWFDEDDGTLRYVPGFHALDHACGG
jgi:hypothetical protein